MAPYTIEIPHGYIVVFAESKEAALEIASTCEANKEIRINSDARKTGGVAYAKRANIKDWSPDRPDHPWLAAQLNEEHLAGEME